MSALTVTTPRYPASAPIMDVPATKVTDAVALAVRDIALKCASRFATGARYCPKPWREVLQKCGTTPKGWGVRNGTCAVLTRSAVAFGCKARLGS